MLGHSFLCFCLWQICSLLYKNLLKMYLDNTELLLNVSCRGQQWTLIFHSFHTVSMLDKAVDHFPDFAFQYANIFVYYPNTAWMFDVLQMFWEFLNVRESIVKNPFICGWVNQSNAETSRKDVIWYCICILLLHPVSFEGRAAYVCSCVIVPNGMWAWQWTPEDIVLHPFYSSYYVNLLCKFIFLLYFWKNVCRTQNH